MLTKKQIEQRKRGIPIGAVATYEVRTGDWRLNIEHIKISRPSGSTYCISGMQQQFRDRKVRNRFTTFAMAYTAMLIYLGGRKFRCISVDNCKFP